MPRAAKKQATKTPIIEQIQPEYVIVPDIVEIAYSDIVTALLMRLNGKTLDDIAKYLKIEVSKLQEVEIIKNINNKLFAAMLGEIAKQADYDDALIKSMLTHVVINALIFKRDSARNNAVLAISKIIEDLSKTQTELQDELNDTNIKATPNIYLRITKEIANIGKSISKLQTDLAKINRRQIEATINDNDIVSLLPYK